MTTNEIQSIEVATPFSSVHLRVSRRNGLRWASLFYKTKAGPYQSLGYASCYTDSEISISTTCSGGWTLWMGQAAFEIATKEVRKLAGFLDCHVEENAE
ncbi:hypothetical protein [Herbaspirillum sp. C7C8]|uniref:hypothetical protein n=1 Tax=Herbaspirillum sp. C7C8 TaxID=2736665 RepID=UPI001F51D364|nr:hypothetical protein [Herbaspirillum sp. C7C8]MCI1005018.1 hypothetical protein [Herbaspirillum sp. C7C8]